MRPPPACPDPRSPSAGERTAFYIGNNTRLSDQYRIRDHMLVHYDKILTAKAAVDCSVPKSMIKSIKYSDQQRREKMNREVARLEKESLRYGSFSRLNSRASGKDAIVRGKDTYDGYTNMARQSLYSDRRAVSSAGSYISSPSPLRSPEGTAEPHSRKLTFSRMSARTRCGFSDSPGWSSSASCQFRDSLKKTYSGDLLEKHSHYFSNKQQPHTPRTLRTPAKSVIAQCRYYTPPRRKRRESGAEDEAWADMSRSRQRDQAQEEQPLSDRGHVTESEALPADPDEHSENLSEEEKIHHQVSEKPNDRQRRRLSREEELAYLNFVAAVTNEILSLGLFSDRVLERVFERHLQENKHHLDVGKMRCLLDTLKADLNRKDENNLQSFIDHLSDANEHFTSPIAHQDGARNEVSRSQGNLSQHNIEYAQRLSGDLLIYLDDKDAESHLIDDLISLAKIDPDHEKGNKQDSEPVNDLPVFIEGHIQQNEVLIGQDEREVQSPVGALSCLDERESGLLHESNHGFQDDQGGSGHGYQDDQGGSGHGLQDDHGESNHVLPSDGLQVSEITPDEDQIGSRSDRTHDSDNFEESSHHSNTDQLKNLEDLEQSFYEIVHVSNGKDCSDPGDVSEGERDYAKE
ncbi:spermatogenesis-associated protein 7 isoform X2 [Pseudophryne corroboree]|uniref:spermatogenesis-associated protein 7 isoform X2 n=1 Tax=Pseudophryne corroboree TaxID=495146 RepID=UPI0030821C5D